MHVCMYGYVYVYSTCIGAVSKLEAGSLMYVVWVWVWVCARSCEPHVCMYVRVWVYVCIWIWVCARSCEPHVCMYVWVWVYVCIWIWVCARSCEPHVCKLRASCMYVWIWVWVYVYMWIWVWVCARSCEPHVCMYVWVWVCVYEVHMGAICHFLIGEVLHSQPQVCMFVCECVYIHAFTTRITRGLLTGWTPWRSCCSRCQQYVSIHTFTHTSNYTHMCISEVFKSQITRGLLTGWTPWRSCCGC
jgi:hypothetical protein